MLLGREERRGRGGVGVEEGGRMGRDATGGWRRTGGGHPCAFAVCPSVDTPKGEGCDALRSHAFVSAHW